jgi:hypothetical protein
MAKKTFKQKAAFYDEVNLEDAFDFDSAKLIQPALKKVNINITEQQIELASKLAAATGNGYQNMIKTAISIGLKNLEETILKTT